jgi:hypothetical protein
MTRALRGGFLTMTVCLTVSRSPNGGGPSWLQSGKQNNSNNKPLRAQRLMAAGTVL